MTAEEIRKEYKEPLTLESIRKILKISKRRAAWLLQNGYIKYTPSNNNRRAYYVMIDDLMDYVNKTESGELVIKMPKGNYLENEADDNIASVAFPKNPPANLKEWLVNEWKDLDEMLPRSKVFEITGYSERTLKSWGSLGHIKNYTGSSVVTVKNTSVAKMVFIKKDSLIEYLCSENGFANLKKSKSTTLSAESSKELNEYLLSAWKDLDENLSHSDVVEITGYSLTNVKRLVTEKKVESFMGSGVIKSKDLNVSNMTFISKSSLIDYLCGDGYKIQQKTQTHIDLLLKFFEK